MTTKTAERVGQLAYARKVRLLQRWPECLDQQLRLRYGDALLPDTGFNKETRQYETKFTQLDGVSSAEVLSYIEGFQTAVSVMLES